LKASCRSDETRSIAWGARRTGSRVRTPLRPPCGARPRRNGAGDVDAQGEFANQQAFRDYADAHDLAYLWEGTNAFAMRWRLAQLSQPGTYELVEVRTKRGVTRAHLFSKRSCGRRGQAEDAATLDCASSAILSIMIGCTSGKKMVQLSTAPPLTNIYFEGMTLSASKAFALGLVLVFCTFGAERASARAKKHRPIKPSSLPSISVPSIMVDETGSRV
jgi:hypothetical protein